MQIPPKNHRSLAWVLLCALGPLWPFVAFGLPSNAGLPQKTHSISKDALHSLGKALFFEKQLSRTGTKSCASCHDPKLAFTDHYRRGLGLEAEILPRNTPSLINVKYFRSFNWANPDLAFLEAQFEGPLFGKNPVEMGMERSDLVLQERLSKLSGYKKMFGRAYPRDDDPVNWGNALKALAEFVGSLVSFNSPYDRFHRGNVRAMSASAQRGERLFNSPRLQCAVCHPPPNFTDNYVDSLREGFHNIGLYNINGNGEYPPFDQGVFSVTHKQEDKGKFRTPSLRNVALTPPYMHDGSVETLEEVVGIFEAGGRTVQMGDYAGDGRKNPNKSPLLKGFHLSEQERRDLIAFLCALTD